MKNHFADLQDDLPWTEPAVAAHDHQHDEGDGPRGQLTEAKDLRRFIFAGRATFTIRSRKTDTRFTFRFTQPKEPSGYVNRRGVAHIGRTPTWASVLSGSDNTAPYSFIGTIWQDANGYSLRPSAKSKVSLDAPSAKALLWVIRLLNVSPEKLLEQAEVWHEGRCGRCGRKLTVPESIANGLGPECAGRAQ